MDISGWVAVISAGIALISLLTNYAILRRQVHIQAEQVSASLDADKAKWLGDVLHTFGEASALVQLRSVYPKEAFSEHQLELSNRFSILADQGRLYFPNISPETRGTHKLSAFRGARRPVLNGVILAYDVTRCLDQLDDVEDKELLGILFDLRRVVVSEVQFSTDPRRREAVLAQARKITAEQTSEARSEVRKLIKRVAALPGCVPSFERKGDEPQD